MRLFKTCIFPIENCTIKQVQDRHFWASTLLARYPEWFKT